MKNKYAYTLLPTMLFALLQSCDWNADTQIVQLMNNGRELYNAHCANCHQQNGEGLAKLIPPLKESSFLKQSPLKLPCIIQKGMNDPVIVNGTEYHLKMPANNKLSEKEIFYITNFVLFTFINSAEIVSQDSIRVALNSCRE